MTLSDTTALDSIANLLGTSPEWNSAADYLESIANIIGATGRQHPGDADPDTYNPRRSVMDDDQASGLLPPGLGCETLPDMR